MQAASIYSADCKDGKIVAGLAGARSLVNAHYVVNAAERLLTGNKISKKDALAFASGFCRGNYIIEDLKNLKNSDALASQNTSKKNDNSLKNKQYCQYAWLAINKALPHLMNNIDATVDRNCVMKYAMRLISIASSPIVLELSELYRQKLMYAMIGSNKKSA